jgi:predicted Mrr-cat superfamily restriction endonuclease
LREASAWGEFRKLIKAAYHGDEAGFRRAGAAAGHAWNFVHDMVPGCWVVVPRSGEFYVAQVSGDVSYDDSELTMIRPIGGLLSG